MIGLPAGTRIWLAAGITDMRAGMNGLAARVETALAEDPFSGWVFRSIVPTDSGPSCPAIPVHRAHPFRSIVPSLMG